MPVEATVKDRVKLPGRAGVSVIVQHVGDLVGVLPMYAIQRESCKAPNPLGIYRRSSCGSWVLAGIRQCSGKYDAGKQV